MDKPLSFAEIVQPILAEERRLTTVVTGLACPSS
jgi:hypothetical protein